MGPAGACVSCGLLALRARTRLFSEEWAPFEAIEHQRRYGQFWLQDGERWPGESFPWCLRHVLDFHEEMQTIAETDRDRVFAEFIAKPRDCDDWHEYVPTITPMQALEEANMIRISERERRFQTEMAERRTSFEAEQERRLVEREDRRDKAMLDRADRLDAEQRDWQKEQEAAAERRHDEQQESGGRQHRRELWVFGGVIAVATVVASLIEVFFGGMSIVFR